MKLRLGERATLVPAGKGNVYGIVMRLTQAEIHRLYSEPSVAAYRAEPVVAQLADGTAEVALCFNLPTPPDRSDGDPQYAAALKGRRAKNWTARIGATWAYRFRAG